MEQLRCYSKRSKDDEKGETLIDALEIKTKKTRRNIQDSDRVWKTPWQELENFEIYVGLSLLGFSQFERPAVMKIR